MKKIFCLANLFAFCFLLGSVSVYASPTPVITLQPVNDTVCSGSTALFFVAATNSPTSYYWQVSTDGGTTWAPVAPGGVFDSVTTDTLRVNTSLSLNGSQFKCIPILGADSAGLESLVVILSVDTAYVAITGSHNICMGDSVILTPTIVGGVWSNSLPSIDSVNSIGKVFGIATGTDLISYSFNNKCGLIVSGFQINIITSPIVSSIIGASAVCAGIATTLVDDSTGGTWSNSFTSLATISGAGVYTGLSIGTDTVFYSITNACGTTIVSKTITIDTLPSSITGPSNVCLGSTITLSDIISGGTWSSYHTTIDTIDNTGIVTPHITGLDTIKYTLVNGCGTNIVTKDITIKTLPVVATITGPSKVCIGSFITLLNDSTGGVWSNHDIGVDSINSTNGKVYGLTQGSDTINYLVTNVCGTTTVSKLVTVERKPSIIGGVSSVCVGGTITLSDSVAGGSWIRLHAAYDSVNSAGGVVHGVAVGLDTIRYILTNSCGTDTVTKPISIITVPTVSAIGGSSIVCVGSTLSLSDGTIGGTWSNDFLSYDTVSTTGVVHGLHRGIDTIRYTVTNGCGSTTVQKTITIDSIPNAGIISGLSSLCVGSTILLSESATGGVWSHNNNLIDTLHGVTYGVIKGLAAGNDTVNYTVTNTCGTSVAHYLIRVDTLNGGVITGLDSVCTGATITLTESTTGGLWSSTHPTKATVNSLGVVNGITAGTDSIIYSVTNSCGTRRAAILITVKQSANSGIISGPTSVCVGGIIVLNDTASGGVWTNRHITLDTLNLYASDSVILGGVSAGIDTITYSVTNSCGTATTNYIVSIDTNQHAGAVSGATHVCSGSSITLASSPAGGTWATSSMAIAVIDSFGHLTGVANGTVTITYTFTNACGSDSKSHLDTVFALPNAGAIIGASSVCLGSAVTFTDTITGGTWNATNSLGNITSGGIFTSLNHGFDTIYYSVSDAHCIGKAMMIERIDTMPVAYPITGPTSVCVGSLISLANVNVLGTHSWVASNTNATVSSIGAVIGMAGGMDTIMYYFANACGTDTESLAVSIQTPLMGGMLSGPISVCQGSMITLTDTVAGGTWLSSNPYVASVDGPGLITGRHVGTVLISYTFWNACGSATDTQSVQVFGVALPIMGLDSVGLSLTRTLTDITPGGVWYSVNSSIASIDATGKVTGLLAGVDTIKYIVTNPCGTSSTWIIMHVGALPTAGAIFGPDSVCGGLNIVLGDTTVLGGVWSSKNSLATVNSYGIVTGVTGPGIDSIYYSFTNGFGTGKVLKKVYVNTIPAVHVHHYPIIALGGVYPLIDTPCECGVWWTSDNSSITIAGAHMIVLAPTHKNWDTLVYSVTTTCGTGSDTLIYYLPYPSVVENKNANPISAIKVFPNPSNGTFTIAFTSEIEENANITVTNIVGQKVQEFEISSNKLSEISINQPDGVYLLTATTANSRYDVKVVITR